MPNRKLGAKVKFLNGLFMCFSIADRTIKKWYSLWGENGKYKTPFDSVKLWKESVYGSDIKWGKLIAHLLRLIR